MLTTWQTRHLVLGKDKVLRVYKVKGDPMPHGSVMLHGAEADRADALAGKPNAVRLASTRQKELVFACDTVEQAQEWVRALNQAATELGGDGGGGGAGGAGGALARAVSSRFPGNGGPPPLPPGASSSFGASAAELADDADGGRLTPPLQNGGAANGGGVANGVPTWPAQVAHLKLSGRELFEWGLLFKLLHSYIAIIQRNVADLVPKAITHQLVNTSLSQLTPELLRAFGPGPETDALMGISKQAEEEYASLRQLVQTLTECQAIVRQVGAGSRDAERPAGGVAPLGRRFSGAI